MGGLLKKRRKVNTFLLSLQTWLNRNMEHLITNYLESQHSQSANHCSSKKQQNLCKTLLLLQLWSRDTMTLDAWQTSYLRLTILTQIGSNQQLKALSKTSYKEPKKSCTS